MVRNKLLLCLFLYSKPSSYFFCFLDYL